MKENQKIKVNWIAGTSPIYSIDFGMFKSPNKSILVDREIWSEYCILREAFEVMQRELMDRLPRTVKTVKK